ncbi:MAG: hypothetical protein ACU85V_08720 [Gammaproteobacteria bacterium]
MDIKTGMARRAGTSRKRTSAMAWAVATLLGILPLASQAMGVSTAQAGYSDQVVVEFPGIATASDSGDDGTSPNPVSWSSTATASPSGISASVTVTGLAPTGAQYAAGGSFSSASDTTFDYASDFQGGQADWVEFGLGGFLTGSIVGQGRGGTGSGFATISLSGPIYDAPNGGLLGNVFASTGIQGGSVRSFDDSQTININVPLSTGFYAVPRGAAISFTIAMSVTAFGDNSPFGDHGTVTSNFSDTFKLDADEVFTILTPGITVNSPSAGIVNNALPAPVPVPGGLVLLLSALAPLIRIGARWTRA